jgi:DNA processing protein
LRSGALITANSALNQGREVFAVPAGIFSPGAAGVNKLIQDGAHPVTDVKDILDSLNLYMVPQHAAAQAILPDNAEERALLTLITHEAIHVDEIIRESGFPAHLVSSTLTMMELKGMIRQVGSMQYVLAR